MGLLSAAGGLVGGALGALVPVLGETGISEAIGSKIGSAVGGGVEKMASSSGSRNSNFAQGATEHVSTGSLWQ